MYMWQAQARQLPGAATSGPLKSSFGCCVIDFRDFGAPTPSPTTMWPCARPCTCAYRNFNCGHPTKHKGGGGGDQAKGSTSQPWSAIQRDDQAVSAAPVALRFSLLASRPQRGRKCDTCVLEVRVPPQLGAHLSQALVRRAASSATRRFAAAKENAGDCSMGLPDLVSSSRAGAPKGPHLKVCVAKVVPCDGPPGVTARTALSRDSRPVPA